LETTGSKDPKIRQEGEKEMKTKSKIRSFIALNMIASILFTSVTVYADDCRRDQSQLMQTGQVMLGGETVLGQTFVPSIQGQHVCRIKIAIRKNFVAAGDLKLTVMDSRFAELDSASIDDLAIPLGNSTQVFEFGCDGQALAGHAFYGLKLAAAGAVGGYAWKGAANNPYARPANRGQGWRNPNGGAGTWTSLGGWDYAFQIYLCD
jgi:hypothetical protein